ncbi:hypothetical protein MHYP_G00290110 [Metynnis hypsauchen]
MQLKFFSTVRVMVVALPAQGGKPCPPAWAEAVYLVLSGACLPLAPLELISWSSGETGYGLSESVASSMPRDTDLIKLCWSVVGPESELYHLVCRPACVE